jgi:hypothetical protein
MLLVLIPIAWLAVATTIVAICCMAARGDSQPQPIIDTSPMQGLALREGTAPTLLDRRPAAKRPWRPALHDLAGGNR